MERVSARSIVSYLRAVQRHTPEGTGNVKIYLTSLSGSDSDAIYSYHHLILHDASGAGKSFYRERTLPPEVMANIEAKYHLNDPIMTQYFNYLKQLAHGDFGPSLNTKIIPSTIWYASFPVSAKLGFAAFYWRW